MKRVILNGAGGHMGRAVARILAEEPECTLVGGVDPFVAGDGSFPIWKGFDEIPADVQADVVIDFSTASAVDALLSYVEETKTPVVLCTTGLSEEQLQRVDEVSGKVAVLRSANMSLGINTLLDLLKKATEVFGAAGFDIEIVEAHHNQKLDAPSGTALALADSINEAAGGKYEYVYDRSQRREKRHADEIGLSAVRGGSIVGEHEVIFAGLDEVITFKHQAFSKSVFAKGAVAAAKFLAGKGAGMYDMRDVVA